MQQQVEQDKSDSDGVVLWLNKYSVEAALTYDAYLVFLVIQDLAVLTIVVC